MSGTDDFSTLVVGGDLFVDKSLMIKELLDNGSEAILITRPRRWGKSINMSMIKRFFEIEVDVNGNVLADEEKINKKLFSGGKINVRYNEPKKLCPLKIASVSYVMKRQGEFPVIFLSLKDIKGNNYQIMESKVREKIIKVFEDYEYLLNSTYISSLDKKKFEDYLSNNITIDRIHSSLLFLSKLLFKHFKQKVYILIDEYDTPINEAYCKFGDKTEFENVLELFRGIFGSCLKGNEYLEKGFITGILRIAKANLFSDLNNVTEYTILDNNFSQFYGFTESEVSKLLNHAFVEIEQTQIRDWYNGYKIGEKLLYNPWSIMQCISSKKLGHYWVDSGGTALIDTVLKSDDIQQDLQRLLENKKLTKYLHKQISLMDINDNKDVFFSLLVFAGYLNAELDNRDDEYPLYSLSIPNKEIRSVYVNHVKDWISNKLNIREKSEYDHFMKLLTQGEIDKFFDKFKRYLIASTSHHDLYCERDYHNLMGGIFAPLSHNYIIESNLESGYGRFDHRLISRSEKGDKAFIIEYKVGKEEKELVKLAQEGLKQITDKAYTTTIDHYPHIKKIFKIAVAFCGKEAVMEYSF
ncbi:MAG TPA: ATP-binding protein [Rickettsia endosymbiont of Bembidion lapponicum]|nr:ATP-binding protein [Rickettsia endosymbiont of Bembidion lapponicum]